MKNYFGYIRVSTQRQGAHGVSLQEQKAAIEAYAQRTGLAVVAWYEERETAAKRGRRVFAQMMKELARGKADGIIIHKIDRSARNLRDWADLGELIDRGVDVHFAHDALDLRSRGGRLSADIQAVVAADYIRNLREETRKGFYGRLKQGLYPLRAPIGYRDMGRGKPKEIDPIKGPLVRAAFELYATAEWNFDTLLAELARRGLRGHGNARLSRNGLTTMLNNPFYVGLISIRKTGEMFEGVHPPLVSKALYNHVQAVLRGRRGGVMPLRHDFVFRRLLRCGACSATLIGERHKERYVYYRCQGPSCHGTCINEIIINDRFRVQFARLAFTEVERGDLRDMITELRGSAAIEREKREQSLRMQLAQCEERLARLIDALIDGLIDKSTFDARKRSLLVEKRGLMDQLLAKDTEKLIADKIEEFLELSNTAELSYASPIVAEKRDVVNSTTSNCMVYGKTPAITLKSPYQELINLRNSIGSDPQRDDTRTLAQRAFEIMQAAAEKDVGVNGLQMPTNDNELDKAA